MECSGKPIRKKRGIRNRSKKQDLKKRKRAARGKKVFELRRAKGRCEKKGGGK